MKKSIILFLLLLVPYKAFCQVVEEIKISGLRWSKEEFVRKEILLKVGEEFSKKLLKASVRNLLNTHLFYKVKTKVIKSTPGKVKVIFLLKEKYPVVPLPKVKIKGKNNFKLGLEVRNYNFRGLGDKLFVKYEKWNNGDKNFRLYLQLYRAIKDRISPEGEISYGESKEYRIFENRLSTQVILNRKKTKFLTPAIYLTKVKDKKNSCSRHFVSPEITFTLNKATDYVFYTEGKVFKVSTKFSLPRVSSSFGGKVTVNYGRSVHLKEADTYYYSFLIGTTVGHSHFSVSSGVPGYKNGKSIGKKVVAVTFNYRKRLIDKTVFIKPTLKGAAVKNEKTEYLLAPGIVLEAFWSKLVDGIIKGSLFRGIGNNGDTQFNLTLNFRW